MTDTTPWTVRPVTDDDVDALVDLLAAAEAVDRTEEHYDADDLREELADPQLVAGKDWVLAELAGRVVGHQHVVARAPSDGVQKLYLDGAVHPEHRGRGIGSDLVARMVARGREHAEERGARAVLAATAPTDAEDAATLLEEHGLAPHRWTFVMQAQVGPGTEEPDAPTLPAGFTLSTWEGIDADEIRETHNRAFVDHPGFTPWSPEMWEQWVTGSRNARPAASLALRDADGAVAAYVQTQEYDAATAATGRREAFVAKVGTVPEHRRQGLAGLVLRHALHRYAAEGYETAALDVDYDNPTGANALYERVGFRVTRRWTNFQTQD